MIQSGEERPLETTLPIVTGLVGLVLLSGCSLILFSADADSDADAAVVQDADLAGDASPEADVDAEGPPHPDADLEDADLEDADLQDADLQDGDLEDADHEDDADDGEDGGEGDSEADGGCVPTPESCNGADDNCDGAIDEGACLGCEVMTWGGGTYLFCAGAWLPGDAAAAECALLGYHLVTIDDGDEQAWLWGVAEGLAWSDWWLGLSDATLEGVYVWTDGTVAWDGAARAYTNWRDDPLVDHDGEDCVELDLESGGLWADDGCEEAEPYICEL